MTKPSSSPVRWSAHRVWGSVLAVALGVVAWIAWSTAKVDHAASVPEASAHQILTPAPATGAGGSSTVVDPADAGESRRVRANPGQALVGSLVWSDERPVVAAAIEVADAAGERHRTHTDAAGHYEFHDLVLPPDLAEVPLLVHPPCHVEASAVAVVVTPHEVGLRAAAATLPAEGDLRVEIVVDPEVRTVLAAQGLHSALLAVSARGAGSPLPRRLVSRALTGFDAESQVVRLPFVQGLTVLLLASGDTGGRQLTSVEGVVQRDAVSSARLLVTRERVLRGVVVDHEGQPFPDASVIIHPHDPKAPTGRWNDRVDVSVHGEFVSFAWTPGLLDVVAEFGGVRTRIESIPWPTEPMRLVLDTSALQALRLHAAGQAIERFGLDPSSSFAARKAPSLPRRERGRCWLPQREVARDFLLAWQYDGQLFLHRLWLPVDGEGEISIDVRSLAAPPCGELRVDFGAQKDVLVRLHRDDGQQPGIIKFSRLFAPTPEDVGSLVSLVAIPAGSWLLDVLPARGRSLPLETIAVTVSADAPVLVRLPQPEQVPR
jgi:hypothetical protein